MLDNGILIITFLVRYLLPHPAPFLCGVDVSYETPPFNKVLRFLQWQFSLGFSPTSRSWCYLTNSNDSRSLSCPQSLLLPHHQTAIFLGDWRGQVSTTKWLKPSRLTTHCRFISALKVERFMENEMASGSISHQIQSFHLVGRPGKLQTGIRWCFLSPISSYYLYWPVTKHSVHSTWQWKQLQQQCTTSRCISCIGCLKYTHWSTLVLLYHSVNCNVFLFLNSFTSA